MPAKKTAEKETSISVMEVTKGRVNLALVGTTPFIANRMSEKARQTILFPPEPKNRADRASTLKHNVLDEYRASPYRIREDDAPTFLAMVATAFKKALSAAALDLPGATKAKIGRLTYVEGSLIPIYGIPQLSMMVTRSADIDRTPDVRTRAIIPHWVCLISVVFITPLVREQAILNLMAAAGMTVGIGDYRVEKGAGNYGLFRLASADDPELREIIATGGRDVQQAAMEHPSFYDEEAESLFAWYQFELKRRGFKNVEQLEDVKAWNGPTPDVLTATNGTTYTSMDDIEIDEVEEHANGIEAVTA